MMILLGNLIALLASILMVSSGLLTKKSQILIVQIIQLSLQALSNAILGGFTGAITNILGCFRNIICYKHKLTYLWKIILIVIMVLLSLKFNTLGIIGFLPVISVALYTWFIDTKKIINFKWLIVFTAFLWLIFDLRILSFTAAIFDIGNIISNLIAIILIKKGQEK